MRKAKLLKNAKDVGKPVEVPASSDWSEFGRNPDSHSGAATYIKPLEESVFTSLPVNETSRA
jgi:hypothetical protein